MFLMFLMFLMFFNVSRNVFNVFDVFNGFHCFRVSLLKWRCGGASRAILCPATRLQCRRGACCLSGAAAGEQGLRFRFSNAMRVVNGEKKKAVGERAKTIARKDQCPFCVLRPASGRLVARRGVRLAFPHR